jgi:hypothetical protein
MRARRIIGTALTATLVVGMLASATPAGAVRLETEMDGGNEVPGPGDPDGTGVARVRVNVRAQRVCYAISVQDITLPATAAHIHRGAAGVDGPPRITLNNPTQVGTSGIGLAFGCEGDVRKVLLRRIRANPDRFYVNVHTSDFPAGAIRGQLG